MTLSFIQSHKASYGHVVDHRELNFRVFNNGEFFYEFMIVGEMLSGLGEVPRLKIFNESWRVFTDFPMFFVMLSELENASLDEIADACISYDYCDMTEDTRAPAPEPSEADKLRQRMKLMELEE